LTGEGARDGSLDQTALLPARTLPPGCDGAPHPAVVDAREVVELEQRARLDSNRRAWKAIRLAPTIEVFEALVRRESVPIAQLDQSWVRRFGLRPGASRSDRYRADAFNSVPSTTREASRAVLGDRGELAPAGGAP
jgi:hypothetical protein